MSRQKVREVSPASAIQGVARPVNTYWRPADPAPSDLHDVARGLASLSGGLSGLLKKREGEASEAESMRGKAEFYKNNQIGYAEGVRQGLIPANSSPDFMRAWKKEQGNLAGIRLREKFNVAYNSWEGRNSNDGAAFQQFLGDFIATNMGDTTDPDVLRGLNPHLDSLLSSGIETYAKESGQAAYNGAIATNGAIMGETLDYAVSQGVGDEGGLNADALWEDLMRQREAALATGIREEDYDKALVDAIADKAEEHGDEDILGLLDRTLPGSDTKLSSSPEFRDRKAQSASRLSALEIARMAAEDKQAEKLAKAEEDFIVSTVGKNLATDPTIQVPEEVMKRWRKVDPMADQTLAKMRKTLTDAVGLELPSDLLEVERRIMDGATERDILDMVSEGFIKDPATLSKYLDRAKKRSEGLLEGKGILTTQSAKRIARTIKERTMPADWDAPFAPDGLTDEGIEATRDFEEALMEWEVANPDASMSEREKFINDTGELILKRIIPDERQYMSPEDAQAIRDVQEEEANQMVLEGQSQQQQGQLGASGMEQEAVRQDEAKKSFWRIPTKEEFKDAMGIDAGLGGKPRQKELEERSKEQKAQLKEIYQSDQPPALDALEPSYRKRLEEEAAKEGMTPEEYNMEIWKRLKQALLGTGSGGAAPDGTPVVQTAYAPGQETNAAAEAINANFNPGSMIDEAILKARPRAPQEIKSASPILDLIGKTEGTDKGRGYNETLGYGAYTGGDVDLVNMTLGDIDKLQTKMLRHPNNKWNSSALGRYQIIRTTLRGLKKEMGLTDDMKFTPELQDLMAVQLLKRRGYDKWLRGQMTDKAFVNGLSREWASLPNSSGKGSYSGQRIGASLEALHEVINNSRDNRIKDTTTPTAYSNIPEDEVHQFMEWNSDPIANHEENLKSIDQDLADVVRRAQEIADVKFVVGSGKRSKELQKKAIKWGWSKTMSSDHLHGGAVDLWPLDDNGAIKFDRKLQLKIVNAMMKAAKEKGISLDIGAKWKSYKDYPHFAIKDLTV